MRRMEPVPHLPSGPVASCLTTADRSWRPTSSSRSDRCPQRPYYRFYYGRPGIVAERSAHLPALGVCRWSRSGVSRSRRAPQAAWVALRHAAPNGLRAASKMTCQSTQKGQGIWSAIEYLLGIPVAALGSAALRCLGVWARGPYRAPTHRHCGPAASVTCRPHEKVDQPTSVDSVALPVGSAARFWT
jgi:hypothetical protein